MTALIPDRLRGAALAAAGVAVLLVAALAGWLHDRGATSFDDWAVRHSVSAIGPDGAHVLSRFSEPIVTVTVIALVAVIAAVARRWHLMALAVAAPLLAIGLTEYVLKPLVGRYLFERGVPVAVLRAAGDAFPSGHETGAASAAALVLIAMGQLRLGVAARTAVALVLAAWTALAALGLVRNQYHYATDTIGAVGVAVAVVLSVAVAVDATLPALVRRRQLT